MSDEHESDEGTESEESGMRFIPGVGMRSGTAKPDPDAPLSNVDPIPLVPDADKRMAKRAVCVAVHRLDPPGHGFKGKVPVGVGLDYIARLYGDGNYTFEALNAKDEVLRRREAVPVSMGIDPVTLQPKNQGGSGKGHAVDAGLVSIIQDLTNKLTAIGNRDDAQTREIVQQARDAANKHIEMASQLSKDSATRDHEHHKAQADSQKQFFESILAAAQQGANMMMTQLTTIFTQQQVWQAQNHQQTMQLMMAMHERELQSNNPAVMLKLFREGMEAGQSQNGPEGEPWERGLSLAFGGIKELRGLAQDAGKAVEHRRRLIADVRKAKALGKGGQPTGPTATTTTPSNKERSAAAAPDNDNRVRVIVRRRRQTVVSDPESTGSIEDAS